MVKGAVPFDAEAAKAALRQISEEASYIPSLFQTEALDPKSEALPVIWGDFDTFASRAKRLENTAARLAGGIETAADLGPAVQQIGKACGACHADFRAK
jgi:cytochrome c556